MDRPLRPDAAIVFIGFMGAGKSTAAREAAAAVGGSAIDTDALIERRLGHPIAEEFRRNGEDSFRRLEQQVVCEVLDAAGPKDMVALGGGSVLSEQVQQALGRHTVALLDVDADTAWERAVRRRRPLAQDLNAFRALYAERRALYDRLADAVLPARGRELPAGLIEALRRLPVAPAATRLLWATSASGSYPVYVGPGLLDAGFWPLPASTARRFCVTDDNVGPLYGDRVPELAGRIRIPAGEASKTLATAERVLGELARLGVTRVDQIVALGGGVVGDLAGFCAASYQRGVPVVHLPTTLVAQVDSAYGGKTGVDLPEAKNYVGAYHQPAAVMVDLDTLGSLPDAEWAAGYAEVLKTALIAGGALWQAVVDDAPLDQAVILGCARLKLAVVAEDERDTGRRQVLNLGHTVGHAIEAATEYGRYRHGEAVGFGLLAALRLSGQDGLREQVKGLLAAHGLPTRLDGVDVDAVLVAVKRDKKRTAAAVPFVLVHAPGDVRPGAAVDDHDLAAAVAELLA